MNFMDRVPFQKRRNDSKICNTPGLPKAATEGHPPDMLLGTLLKLHHVTTTEALVEKFRANNRLKKFNQKTMK